MSNRIIDASESLWKAQMALELAVLNFEKLIQDDESAANTCGEDGEYLKPEVFNMTKSVRVVALRLNRSVASTAAAALSV